MKYPQNTWSVLALLVAVMTVEESKVAADEGGGRETTLIRGVFRVTNLEVQDKYIKVSKHVRLYGRKLKDHSLLIDPATSGLGSVFVSSTASPHIAKPQDGKTVRIALAGGMYCPHVFVADQGDVLEFHSFEEMDAPSIEGIHDDPILPDKSGRQAVTLERQCDKPVLIRSHILPWAYAWIYVRKETQCGLTNRLGEFKIQVESGERVKLRFWHERLEQLAVVPSDNFKVTGPGEIEVKAIGDTIDLGEVVVDGAKAASK